jgi:hypothetical protein
MHASSRICVSRCTASAVSAASAADIRRIEAKLDRLAEALVRADRAAPAPPKPPPNPSAGALPQPPAVAPSPAAQVQLPTPARSDGLVPAHAAVDFSFAGDLRGPPGWPGAYSAEPARSSRGPPAPAPGAPPSVAVLASYSAGAAAGASGAAWPGGRCSTGTQTDPQGLAGGHDSVGGGLRSPMAGRPAGDLNRRLEGLEGQVYNIHISIHALFSCFKMC